ncbi:hypothetical protein KTT_39980 [Tengunoibacter tsumagoiensis]|uniref:Uncharacterized protein n=1 Tax=Tengunoibacter tsumagoiensis TaxID=2014871 RepID=A0A402A501_9CHLR|nr:hypothetical protein KTT_39980 [Tengunoibacter tsumagoiensis]
MVHNCGVEGRFANGSTTNEIREINTSPGGTAELNGKAETVLASAQYQSRF